MKPLNYQSLPALKKYLCKIYGTTVKYKPTASEMRALARLLDALGIADAGVWLKNYSTTLGRTIYLCRRLSDTTIHARDHAVILTHEHAHVWIMDQMGGEVPYDLAYLDGSQRAIIEARCYLAGAEVYWKSTKAAGRPTLPPFDLGKTLANGYQCKSKDIKPAVTLYERGCRLIKRGGIGTKPAQDVARFYEMIGGAE
jgi:hypothetical protein